MAGTKLRRGLPWGAPSAPRDPSALGQVLSECFCHEGGGGRSQGGWLSPRWPAEPDPMAHSLILQPGVL